MEEAAERADDEPNEDQADDVRDHDNGVPVLPVRKRKDAARHFSGSISRCGSHLSQCGRYQFHAPKSCIAAGSSTVRMIVASIRSATAMPNPICWNMTRSPLAKPVKTATMMSAAPVINRAVVATACVTDSAVEPV